MPRRQASAGKVSGYLKRRRKPPLQREAEDAPPRRAREAGVLTELVASMAAQLSHWCTRSASFNTAAILYRFSSLLYSEAVTSSYPSQRDPYEFADVGRIVIEFCTNGNVALDSLCDSRSTRRCNAPFCPHSREQSEAG